MNKLAAILMLALVAACSTDRTPPDALGKQLLRSGDLPGSVSPHTQIAGVVDLPRLRSILPLDQDVTLALKTAGFQAARASAFEQATDDEGCAPLQSPCTGRPTTILFTSIVMTFFSQDGAAEGMQILRKPLKTYSPKAVAGIEDLGDEHFALLGAPGSLTPQMFLAWRRSNVVLLLVRSPASENALAILTPARQMDDRAVRKS